MDGRCNIRGAATYGKTGGNRTVHNGTAVFIDLEKAYDRVHRQEIWRRYRVKGLPDKY